MAKIMVAMSGGVDSSLTAALLRDAGHDITGVTMHLWEGDDERLMESQCCSQEMVEGARRVCAQLGVPYYVFNYQREFRRHVIEYFKSEYTHGYTPNPCLACNRDLKFRFLLERARMLGFDYLATGHFARIREQGAENQEPRTKNQELGSENQEQRTTSSSSASLRLCGAKLPPRPPTPEYQLLRGVDGAKDQSYVLYMLKQEELAQLMFPLGDYTKPEVRAMAQRAGLATADRPESQDICFIPDNDYRRFLREEQPESIQPGPIVDQQGREIGAHQGLPLYTIGQRKGLGLAVGQPLYVTALDTARNTLVVGPLEALERSELQAGQVSFVSGDWPQQPFVCQAQIRAHAAAVPARVTPQGQGQIEVVFERPQRAVTPGQAIVLYDDQVVLGGGRITAAV